MSEIADKCGLGYIEQKDRRKEGLRRARPQGQLRFISKIELHIRHTGPSPAVIQTNGCGVGSPESITDKRM